MTAITVQDLNNAKLDVDLIAEVATSSETTATDRMGNTKLTVVGAMQSLIGYNIRGAWATATAYAVKDIFTDGVVTYATVLAHTSTSIAADLSAGKIALYQGVTVQDIDEFYAPGDFTPGVTDKLTLSRAPGAKNNATIYFGASYQGPNQWSLTDDEVTFNDPIPDGVTEVFILIGVLQAAVVSAGSISDDKVSPSSALFNRIHEQVSVTDFGAKGDGINNDTAAVIAAMAACPDVTFPEGTFLIDQITIPATVKSISSSAGAIIKPGPGVTSGAPADWWQAVSLGQAKISGLTFQADAILYPDLACLSLLACSNCVVEENTFHQAGVVGVYLGNCTFTTVRKNKVYTFQRNGVQCDGALSFGNVIEDNDINGAAGAGFSFAHGISFQLGQFNKALRNHISDTGTFGVASYQTANVIISQNTIFNTIHEGINTEDSNNIEISDNDISWPVSSSQSTDFGISVFGNAVTTQFVQVFGNRVTRAGASGICLTGLVSFCSTNDNTVLNCNVNSVADPGILLSGSSCNFNRVDNNMVVDTRAPGVLHLYGIAEIDKGNGHPSLNALTSNFVRGFIISDYAFDPTTAATSANNIGYA